MKRVYNIILAAAAVFALASCSNKELQEEFVQNMDSLGLDVKGVAAFEYSDSDCQVGYNSTRNEFWVAKDDMSDYFDLTLDSVPKEGGETTGTLVYTTTDNIVTKPGLKFTLIKTDRDGLLWFWSKQSKIGVVVKKQ